MQGWPSRHPPGAIVMITADTARYALSIQCLMALKVPVGSVLAWHMGVLIARSINDAFEVVMKNPALQWAWIMGDDHTFDPEIVLQLLDRDKDVVLPFCLNRVPPMDPTIVNHDKKRMKYLEELPSSGLYQLGQNETCGDAGLLVRRKVLEAIPAPWYDHRVSGALAAEDQAFIRRIKDAGFDVFVDLDTPLGHIGQVTFIPVKMKDGSWNVRLVGGAGRHLCDLGPVERADDAFRIAAE